MEADPQSNTQVSDKDQETGLKVDEDVVARRVRRPPPKARCEACGSELVSGVPSFSTGSGSAIRAFADDVICHKCGHIGLYVIE